ncbi:MAG: murein biosynthesis integral membrane protein MurJ [Chloroflexia bacterium]|nr:murein biosynthesis integral membrane protein MurJ [Chloroflexia bacterium]
MVRIAGFGRLGRREFGVREASLILIASYLTSAVLGAVRQALLNRQFGADETAGAYYAAARLPDILFTLVAGGALSSAFIPVLIGTRRADGDAAAQRLTGLVLTALVLVLTIAVCIGQLVAPWAVSGLLVPGYSDEGQSTATAVTRIMLLQPVILGIGSVVTALLNSRNRFLLPALAFTSHNIGVIAGIGVAMLWPGIGIYGPAWGAVAGSLLQVGLMLPGLRGDGFRYRPSFGFGDARLLEVTRLLLPNGLGLAVGFGGAVVESSFASRLDNEAALPALHNAWLLVGLPVTLTGTAVGQAVFPRLATHAAALDLVRLRATLLRAFGAALTLSTPAVLVLVGFGVPVIDVLFEHGRFDAAAGDLTYTALLGYVIGIPAYVATELASRGLLALRDARTPFLANLSQLGLRIALTAAFIGPFGLIGIPLAAAAAAAVETAVLLLVLWRRVR